ncbi:hypothetical protein PAEPH01_0880 [Pancytospora epiphaga]|nr:hypothetical protein PAEPH01_0880 [Pancytospora epiphaga]
MKEPGEREFDIIVYGASGFTAQFIYHELEKFNHKIALAARSIYKIPKTHLPLIECSVDDISSIVKRTKILVNCVGPYAHTGNAIISACIASRTNYIDICGETGFIRDIHKLYNETANNARITVIQGCGFDSIPADIGALHLARHFDSVRIDNSIAFSNLKINKGTWASLLNSLGNQKHERNQKKAKSPKASLWRYNRQRNSYEVLFKSTDSHIVRRSSTYFTSLGLSAYDYTAYVDIGSTLSLFLYIILSTFIYFMAQTSVGCYLMLRFPTMFSFGIVEVEGPTEVSMSKSHFVMEFVGHGSSEGIPRRKTLRITGPDPGYHTTAICVAQSVTLLLENESSIPNGVLTPAVAFHKTDIVDRLTRNGIMFQFLE